MKNIRVHEDLLDRFIKQADVEWNVFYERRRVCCHRKSLYIFSMR